MRIKLFFNELNLPQASTTLLSVLAVFLLSACTLPKSMEYRAGNEPKAQDDDVMFRVTYYFRVIETCRGGIATATATDKSGKVHLDSLFRYRMTGKASSLFNEVRFESGIMRSDQIDPFGTSEKIWDVDPFTKNLKAKQALQSKDDANEGEPMPAAPVIPVTPAEQENKQTKTAGNTSTPSVKGKKADEKCTDSDIKLMILGPAGWRDYDKHSRLILAMSSSARPLVQSLKRIASKMKKSPVDAEVLLQIVRERRRVSQALNSLDLLKEGELSPEKIVEAVSGKLEVK
jgi:hypothetical protein